MHAHEDLITHPGIRKLLARIDERLGEHHDPAGFLRLQAAAWAARADRLAEWAEHDDDEPHPFRGEFDIWDIGEIQAAIQERLRRFETAARKA